MKYIRIKGKLAHRIAMEKHLKRVLGRFEVVHHINGVKSDNRLENLEVMSMADHTRHHHIKNNPIARKKWFKAIIDSSKKRRKYVGHIPRPIRLGMKWNINPEKGIRKRFLITTRCSSCKKIRWVSVTYKAKKCRKCYRHFLKSYLKNNKIALKH